MGVCRDNTNHIKVFLKIGPSPKHIVSIIHDKFLIIHWIHVGRNPIGNPRIGAQNHQFLMIFCGLRAAR